MSTNTEYALADATGPTAPGDDKRGRRELAALEAHDEDIPTSDQALPGVKGEPARPDQDGTPGIRRESPPAGSTSAGVTSANADLHASPLIHSHSEHTNHELLPSTVKQWRPSNHTDVVAPTASPTSQPNSGSSDIYPGSSKEEGEHKEQDTVAWEDSPICRAVDVYIQKIKEVHEDNNMTSREKRDTMVELHEQLERNPAWQAIDTAQSHTSEVLRSAESDIDSPAAPEQAVPSMTDATHPPITGQTSPVSSESEKEADLETGRRRSSSSDTEAEAPGPTVSNSNIVNWDGPDDPQNPMNWSAKLKWGNVAVIAFVTFLTPLASSMFAPGIPQVMREFESTNHELGAFSVSIYILGYAFGPLLIAPLSELYGRLPLYHVCNGLFVVLTIACALATNLNMLIGFRFVEGLFGSCPLTIGGGTIADMIPQQKRGGVMAIWALGPLMGPVIGPVAGGYLAQAKGWRWVFWVIAITGGVISIAAFFFLRETYPPVLLERKAAKLREATGNTFLESKLKSPLTPRALFTISIVRPIRMLVFSPIVLALSTYMAVVYGYLYLLFTTITEVYESQYNFNQGSVGLTFLGIGIGSLFGVIIFGFASDRIVKAKSGKGEMKPEYRLPPMMVGSFIIPIGLFLYGWTAEKHVFWIAPIIGTGLVGLGLLATFMPVQTYLVDAFTTYAASALAANTVLRSLLGALLPLAGQKMYATLGLGWGNSLLAFIALAMCPIPWIFYRYGERIRKSPKFQRDW